MTGIVAPPPGGEVSGTARCHEPGALVAATEQAGRGPRAAIDVQKKIREPSGQEGLDK